MDTRAQELELNRNIFYRDSYRRLMGWLVWLVIICAILSVSLIIMTFYRKQPDYYAAVSTGEVVPMHSMSEPMITNDFIVRWSALTVRNIFNLNFSSYQDQLNQLKDQFTQNGWESFSNAINQSGFIDNMVNSKLIMSAVISSSPVILTSMIIDGRFTWRVQMGVLVKFTSASEQRQQSLIITMNIQRVPTLNVSQGIQITDFMAKPAE